MRRSVLFDALARGEYVEREETGKGEPGSEETRRISSDIGVDLVFLDEIVYARFTCAKDVRAGCGVAVAGRASVDIDGGLGCREVELEVEAGREGAGVGASFSYSTR